MHVVVFLKQGEGFPSTGLTPYMNALTFHLTALSFPAQLTNTKSFYAVPMDG